MKSPPGYIHQARMTPCEDLLCSSICMVSASAKNSNVALHCMHSPPSPLVHIRSPADTRTMGNDKQPAGGYDSTKLEPANRPCYSVKITFHRATNVPIADMGARSSDPYVLAQLNTSLKPRHTHDPYLRFRTETKHKTVKPEWNATWVVAGVPEDGFELKARLFDEDPDDHDDRLGKVHYHSGRLSEKWQGPKEESFKVHKTGANFRAYTLRWCASAMKPGRDVHAHLVISIEVLGRTKEDLGKAYTINNFWWIHYSPLIGRLAGTKSNDETGVESFK